MYVNIPVPLILLDSLNDNVHKSMRHHIRVNRNYLRQIIKSTLRDRVKVTLVIPKKNMRNKTVNAIDGVCYPIHDKFQKVYESPKS